MRHEPDPAPEEIYDLLYQLGLSAVSASFFHLAYTVRLVVSQPQRLLAPAWLYPETARHYRADPKTVERNIRCLSEGLGERAGAAVPDGGHLAERRTAACPLPVHSGGEPEERPRRIVVRAALPPRRVAPPGSVSDCTWRKVLFSSNLCYTTIKQTNTAVRQMIL